MRRRFNILHPGHLYFLRQARRLGDSLTVIVAHDETIRRQGRRVIFPAKERRGMVAGVRWVDRAVIGRPLRKADDILAMVRRCRPDIIALGYDQPMDAAMVRRLAPIRVVRIRRYGTYSTRSIINKK